MTLLLIDVGNTQTVVGLDVPGELQTWRLSTVPTRTPDEYGLQLSSLVGDRLTDVDGVALSSVVPAVTTATAAAIAAMGLPEAVVVGPGVRTGMPLRVDNPREVGADRIVNALAAIDRCGSPVITVDFGTAITVDLVGPGGEYHGGSIAPGLSIGADALVSSTAALRRVDVVAPARAVGKNTIEAVQSGLVFGCAGLVDGLVDRFRQEVGSIDVPAIATGGAAGIVLPHCRNEIGFDPHLTLRGLRLVWELNAG